MYLLMHSDYSYLYIFGYTCVLIDKSASFQTVSLLHKADTDSFYTIFIAGL